MFNYTEVTFIPTPSSKNAKQNEIIESLELEMAKKCNPVFYPLQSLNASNSITVSV